MTAAEFLREYDLMEVQGAHYAFPGISVEGGTEENGETVINATTPDIALLSMARILEGDAKLWGVDVEGIEEYLFFLRSKCWKSGYER